MIRFAWPHGVRSIVFVSVNFDAEAYDLKSTSEDRLFGRFSYGRYGVRAGLPRLLAMFERRSVPATFFVSASDAVRNPGAIKALAEAGHEIGSRGNDLAPLPSLGAGEREALQRGRETLAGIAGSAPIGFRAAGGELGWDTLGWLAELGFEYDASFQDDDRPYVIAPTGTTRLVELPGAFALDDAPVYSARHTQARLMKIWREEFEASYRSGCLIPLTLHLRGDMGSTRAARIAVLEEFLSYMQGHPGVQFMTGAQLTRWVKSMNLTPEANPVAEHRATLDVTPYRGDLAIKPI